MCALPAADAICSTEVETLYGDTLQFLYHLSLAILVGGGMVLGSVVAPAVLRTTSSESGARGLFGTSFGAALARWDGLAILCVIVVVITSVLKAGAYEVSGAPEGRLIARWVALAVMSAAVIYSSGWANPVARSLRAQTPAWDDLPESAPLRRAFAGLHQRSSRAMRIAIVAGLVALFLS
jgi:uncharacterized membrane protein